MNSIRKELEALRVAIDEKSSRQKEALYREYRRGILGKMAAQSGKLSRFGRADEDLYGHCARLMSNYKAAVILYGKYQSDISNPEVREIIDGIITVLISRLREFEETTLDSANLANDLALGSLQDRAGDEAKNWPGIMISSSADKNPITAEKNAIISGSLRQLEKAVSERQLDKVALYEVYCRYLNQCQSAINDLDRRKVVQSFLILMGDELEILSTIIKIQIRALEKAVEKGSSDSNANSSHDTNSLEKIAVHKILSLLREAYQHFGRASTEMTAVFHKFEEGSPHSLQSEPESFRDFESFLITCRKKAPIEDNGLEELIALLKSKIEKEAEALLSRNKLDFFKSLYRFRRMVSVEMMLADEMINAFEKLRNDWPKVPEEAEEDVESKSEILKGVHETIEIKVESLLESTSQIKDECTKLLETFIDQNARDPTDEEINTAKEAAWQLWSQDPDNFIDMCPGLPIFAERRTSQEKNSARFNETLEKKLIKFKREILLFEISTYEEIIFYSISRLRELEQDEFKQAAALADDTLNILEVLLKKNNIDLIQPKPHDPFNPKEHEVLMAESNPDFKKGEIVKLMNSGYRQKETILLRANVIAAR